MSDGDLINKAWADAMKGQARGIFLILYEEIDQEGSVTLSETHETLESARESAKCLRLPRNKLLAIKEITYQEGEGLEAPAD